MIKQVFQIFNDISLYGLEKLGLYLSRYRGFVVSVNDPVGYGRVQLQVPDVYGDATYTYWAWPSSNFSGIGYGSQVLPRVNDMVWVEFERGNPKKPLWSHGHFGRDEKPDNLKNVKNYWFKTPGGHTLELDDDKKKLTITNSKGFTITMTEDNIILDNGNKVILEEGGVTITLEDGKNLKLGGEADNAMRYLPINEAMTKLAEDLNKNLIEIAAGIATGGGSYTPEPIQIDISGAKIDNIKTP